MAGRLGEKKCRPDRTVEVDVEIFLYIFTL